MRSHLLVAALVTCLVGVAALVYPSVMERLERFDQQREATDTLVVTNPGDAGPGTLRAAIFASVRAGRHMQIALLAPNIVLRRPLPPLPHHHRLEIYGIDQPTIDATAVDGGPVFSVQGDNITLRDFTIMGARDRAVEWGGQLLHVERMALTQNNVALNVSSTEELRVTGARFAGNQIGIQINQSGRKYLIQDNDFEEHGTAGVWAVNQLTVGVADPHLEIADNRFRSDRQSIVAAGTQILIAGNEISGAWSAGILLIGSGAEIINNRIDQGRSMGIMAAGASDSRIVGNEVARHGAVGVLIREASNLTISDNNIHDNAYGIAVIRSNLAAQSIVQANAVLSNRMDGLILIGDSSVVTDNQLLGNRGAGLRVLDLMDSSESLIVSSPLLQRNVAENNGEDRPERGLYRTEPDEA